MQDSREPPFLSCDNIELNSKHPFSPHCIVCQHGHGKPSFSRFLFDAVETQTFGLVTNHGLTKGVSKFYNSTWRKTQFSHLNQPFHLNPVAKSTLGQRRVLVAVAVQVAPALLCRPRLAFLLTASQGTAKTGAGFPSSCAP